jgi:hypothetical protein
MENKDGKQNDGKQSKKLFFRGKQRNGKQKWKTNKMPVRQKNHTIFLQVK